MRLFRCLVWLLLPSLLACSSSLEEPTAGAPAPLSAAPTSTTAVPSSGQAATQAPPPPSSAPLASAAPTASASSAPTPCPEGMAFVDTVHCPDTPYLKARLRCLQESRNGPNNLILCHRFAPGQTCSVPQRRQRFCIDRFEYPNRRGAHPPVMVSAYDAAGLCAEQGKRMCFQSEWTAACEGPDKLPFPSGHERSSKQCNIDNPYIHPDLDKVHSSKDEVRGPELMRLDQSVASGAMDSCKSGFGVYDLTGNFDEWVLTEWKRGRGKWAGLKGGAWGHVRNACRPMTTSHVPQWSYYFISFRCCSEPDASALPPLPEGDIELWKPPPWSPPKHPGGRPVERGWTPPSQASDQPSDQLGEQPGAG